MASTILHGVARGLGAPLESPWAPLGDPWGPQRVPAKPQDPSRSASGLPRAPPVSFKTTPKLEILKEKCFFNVYRSVEGTQGPLRPSWIPRGFPGEPQGTFQGFPGAFLGCLRTDLETPQGSPGVPKSPP